MLTCADDELIAELRRGGERADRAIAALSAELAAARAVQPAPTPAELDRDTSRRLHPGWLACSSATARARNPI